MRTLGLLCMTVLSVPFPTGAAAQVSVVDEGSFTITRNGARSGKETFTIRKTGVGASDAYVSNGTIDLDGRRLVPALQAGADFGPMKYQLEVRRGEDVVERLKGLAGRGRFSTQVRTSKGESTREFIASDDAVLLDEDVFHQYYFVAQRAQKLGAAGGTISVIVPQRSEQQVLSAKWGADESVVIAGRPVSARHLVLTEQGGGSQNVWVDAAGHVLKVSLDTRGLVIQRDQPPR
jgi:hypothetical protein